MGFVLFYLSLSSKSLVDDGVFGDLKLQKFKQKYNLNAMLNES